MIDWVEALGGRFALDSPTARGTRISIEMPLTAEPIGDVARVPGGGRSSSDDGPPPLPELSQAVDAITLQAAVAASADALYVATKTPARVASRGGIVAGRNQEASSSRPGGPAGQTTGYPNWRVGGFETAPIRATVTATLLR